MKLMVNFLFYFRIDEDEVSVNPRLIWISTAASRFNVFVLQPIGALLLEQCRVEREDQHAFSIGESSSTVYKYRNTFHVSSRVIIVIVIIIYFFIDKKK